MATINVRRLDDGVVQRLKQRAAGNNRSLEGEARHILELAVEGDLLAKRASFLALTMRLRRRSEGRKHLRRSRSGKTATLDTGLSSASGRRCRAALPLHTRHIGRADDRPDSMQVLPWQRRHL